MSTKERSEQVKRYWDAGMPIDHGTIVILLSQDQLVPVACGPAQHWIWHLGGTEWLTSAVSRLVYSEAKRGWSCTGWSHFVAKAKKQLSCRNNWLHLPYHQWLIAPGDGVKVACSTSRTYSLFISSFFFFSFSHVTCSKLKLERFDEWGHEG